MSSLKSIAVFIYDNLCLHKDKNIFDNAIMLKFVTVV